MNHLIIPLNEPFNRNWMTGIFISATSRNYVIDYNLGTQGNVVGLLLELLVDWPSQISLAVVRHERNSAEILFIIYFE